MTKAVTGREVCEAYARFKGVPEDSVAAWAKKFWEASPTGELAHVWAAADELRAAGALQEPAPETCTKCGQSIQTTGAAAVAEVLWKSCVAGVPDEEQRRLAYQAMTRSPCGCPEGGR